MQGFTNSFFVVSNFNEHELGGIIALDNNHTMDSQHSLILFNARVDKLCFVVSNINKHELGNIIVLDSNHAMNN